MMEQSGKKYHAKCLNMKRILFYISFLFSIVLTAQPYSGGYVLDGSFYTGHAPYASYYDTLNQAYATPNEGKPIKFRVKDTCNQIRVLNDTSIVFNYSGIYFFNYQFVVQKTGGTANDVSIWIEKLEGTRIGGSNSIYTIENSSQNYNINYNAIVPVATTDTFKIMFSYPTTDFRFIATGSQLTPPRPHTPSTRITIIKISDL